MGTAYADARSVVMRLDRTICMYNKSPVFVEASDDTRDWNKVHIYHLPIIEQPILVDHRDEAFDYRAFQLGYINLPSGTAHYLMRNPSRQQSQGLARRCTYSRPRIEDHDGDSNWFFSAAMRDCILGVYPSIEEAIHGIDTHRRNSTGVHREIALEMFTTGIHHLLYRGRAVGFGNKEYTLYSSKEKEFLRDAILEAMDGRICLKE